MKKLMLLMIFSLILNCTACVKEDAVSAEQKHKTSENREEQFEKNADIVMEDGEKKTEAVKNEKQKIAVYYSDGASENMLTEVSESDELTENVVWNLLIEKKVISKECEINAFMIYDKEINLDVNENFGIQLRSYGIAGEEMMLKCVVNTFLDNFRCERMTITENGEILCSEHREYNKYFTKDE